MLVLIVCFTKGVKTSFFVQWIVSLKEHIVDLIG